MRNLLLFFLITFTIMACDPPVVFDQAYPIEEEILIQIPKDFRGVYMSKSDSTLIWITAKNIIHESYHYFESNIDNLYQSEFCRIEDGHILIPGKSACIPLDYQNDTMVSGEYIVTDTLFKMSSNASVKLFNGQLVISQKLKECQWMVHALEQDKGNLVYRAILDEDSFLLLDEITAMEEISDKRNQDKRYRISPSQHEFETLFMDENIFVDCEYLQRVQIELPPNCVYPIKSGSNAKH